MGTDRESGLSARGAKHVASRPNGNLREIEISWAALKPQQPCNETLKASMSDVLALV